MLQATGLTKRFGRVLAVDGVDLRVRSGCVTGMLGPNGAGKTTTLRMLCGVLAPDSGRVELDGIDMQQFPRRAKATLGWLPDAAPAWFEMRVSDWLMLRATLFGASADGVQRAIERCALTSVRHRIIGRLSRGFRQRVALAAAIVHDPAVLILDEPGTGLDPVQQGVFRDLIRSLAQECAVLLSTHQLSDAQAMCDELVLLSAGRVVAHGTVDELRRRGGGGRLMLETNGDPTAALSGVAQVKVVRIDTLADGWHRSHLEPVDDADDIRGQVAAAVAQAQLQWRQLSPLGDDLTALIGTCMGGGAS
jgi:ABC-2 type transport system ATP-binding protein